MIYNVVLISAVQQSDLVIYMYIFFIFIFVMVYHRILNIVLCGLQWDLVFYPFYIIVCIC